MEFSLRNLFEFDSFGNVWKTTNAFNKDKNLYSFKICKAWGDVIRKDKMKIFKMQNGSGFI